LGKSNKETLMYESDKRMNQPPSQQDSSARKRRILAVDDEQNVVLALYSALRKLPNCQVVTAASGQQALQLCAQEPFDLLITDFMMPGMDGLELAKRIRERHPETAIIMITAYGDKALREQADSAAIQHILDKPFEVQQIRALALLTLNTGKGKEDKA
jgi:CheY-like chemotaxis protein